MEQEQAKEKSVKTAKGRRDEGTKGRKATAVADKLTRFAAAGMAAQAATDAEVRREAILHQANRAAVEHALFACGAVDLGALRKLYPDAKGGWRRKMIMERIRAMEVFESPGAPGDGKGIPKGFPAVSGTPIGAATAEAPAPGAPGTPPDTPITIIEMDKIIDPPDEECHDGDLESLAASLQRDRLLSPIALQAKGAKYRIVLGRRRFKAAKKLGWPEIEARVYPPEVSEQIICRIEAVENLERRDLNPVEEALAVVRLLETFAPTPAPGDADWTGARPQDLQRAADLLGRPLAWVRARASLTRLCPKVRNLVADKKLPLMQAQEIAKLGSAEDQQFVASQTVGSCDAGQGPGAPGAGYVKVESIRRVRGWVAERLSSLRGVPWKLSEVFAGRPACEECPDNSACAVLFGVDKDDVAPEARCLNTACFNAKMKFAEAGLAKTVKDLKGRKDLEATAAGVTNSGMVLAYLKPATVARRLDQARGGGKKSGTGNPGAPGGTGKRKETPYDQTPEYKFRQARTQWEEGVQTRVAAQIVASGGRLACYLLAAAGQTFANHLTRYIKTPDKRVRAKIEPVLKRIAGGMPGDQEALAKDVTAKSLLYQDADSMPLWILRHLAVLMDVALPAEPKMEDFEAAAEKALAKELEGAAPPPPKKGKGVPPSGEKGVDECDHKCGTCNAKDCGARAGGPVEDAEYDDRIPE